MACQLLALTARALTVHSSPKIHSTSSVLICAPNKRGASGPLGVVTNVSDDSEGNHAAWPELWFTGQPVPVPFVHERSLQEVPRDGFGVRFACDTPYLDAVASIQ